MATAQWTCELCGANRLVTAKTEDARFGVCADCRRAAFGFDEPRRGPRRHTEHKDRPALNVRVLGNDCVEDNYDDDFNPRRHQPWLMEKQGK